MTALDTIGQITAALTARRVSALEVVQDRLSMAKTMPVGPFTALHPELALNQAAATDAALAAGAALGPLAGIPLAHKDMYDRAGQITGYGAKPGTGRMATVTAPVLARLDAAGQCDLGRLIMSEYALGPTGHNAHHGMPPNPALPGAITGGSSSGSGSAVGSGVVVAALGSDTGGSIRLPAACCGVVGFKPSQGRVPVTHVMPLSPTQDCVGPLARCVADAALLLRLIAGPDGADATCLPMDWVGEPDGLAGLRIGLDDGGFLRGLIPATVAALEDARRMATAQGAAVHDLNLGFFDHLAEPASVIAMSEAAAIHANRLATASDIYGPQVRARLVQGAAITAQAYLRALQLRSHAMARLGAEIFSRVDILILPSLPGFPPMAEATNLADRPDFNTLINEMTRLTRPASLLGLPALSLPVARTAQGPISLQIIGPHGADARVARVAGAFETLFATGPKP